jgi:hypothetical protein
MPIERPIELSAKLLAAKRSVATRMLGQATRPLRAAAFSASLHPRHNVVGVGAGRKLRQGQRTERACIRLYVERKVPRTAIPGDFLLPETLEGYPTDIIETGRFVAFGGRDPVARKRSRPAQPGCSVGFRYGGEQAQFVMAGTLGAVVQADGARYILSNNHVLADENNLPLGSPIFQPGLLDGGDVKQDLIARMTRFVPLAKAAPNAVDAAIAQVVDKRWLRPRFLPKVGRLRSPTPVRPVEGMRVHKHGRTTGYTTGRVFDVNADVVVEYEMGLISFEDQVLIEGDRGAFSDSGDSGSVIVDRRTGRGTALLFAGSSAYTIANDLGKALSQLGVTLVV